MENIENKPAGITGRIVSYFAGYGQAPSAVAPVAGQREDSNSGTGEENQTIRITHPEGVTFDSYRDVLVAKQTELVAKHGGLRIAQASLPVEVLPQTFETGHGEIILTQGQFSVLLTNGELITV